jgi:hypothetical protein
MADIEKLLAGAKPRETTVQVYMAGDVMAEIERLERQLADAGQEAWQTDSLAASSPTKAIAQKIEAARKRLKASETEFRFRALPDWSDDPAVKTWSGLLAEHPGKNDQELWNPDTFPRALIAACCLDPVMTPEQVDRLFAVLNQAQRHQVFDGAYEANTEGTSLPFSVSASVLQAARGDGK